MRFLSCGFASVIMFKAGQLALNYAHPVPIPLAVFALVAGLFSARFALAAVGLARRNA